MLRSIYETAPKVLVLDHGLTRVRFDAVDGRIRLLLSDWVRRLWTLQEACVPSPDRVYFAFSGEVVTMTTLTAVPLPLCRHTTEAFRVTEMAGCVATHPGSPLESVIPGLSSWLTRSLGDKFVDVRSGARRSILCSSSELA